LPRFNLWNEENKDAEVTWASGDNPSVQGQGAQTIMHNRQQERIIRTFQLPLRDDAFLHIPQNIKKRAGLKACSNAVQFFFSFLSGVPI
jgi:hypothetical protein